MDKLFVDFRYVGIFCFFKNLPNFLDLFFAGKVVLLKMIAFQGISIISQKER